MTVEAGEVTSIASDWEKTVEVVDDGRMGICRCAP